MKKCVKCGEEKELAEFRRYKKSKDGRYPQCKVCEKQYKQANREKYAEYQKQYLQENREKAAEYQKQYKQENREKIAERDKQYYQANREKILERKKQYYQANREKLAEYKKQYDQENREKLAEYGKQYFQKNREAFYAHNQKRRALKRNAAGIATAADIKARFNYHGNRCYYCGCDGNMQIEHRIPLSRGGTHWPANIVPACERCNKSKGAKTEKEFNKPA